jgi:hypothetical protein
MALMMMMMRMMVMMMMMMLTYHASLELRCIFSPDLHDLRCREDGGNLWLVLNDAKDSVHVLQMGI